MTEPLDLYDEDVFVNSLEDPAKKYAQYASASAASKSPATVPIIEEEEYVKPSFIGSTVFWFGLGWCAIVIIIIAVASALATGKDDATVAPTELPELTLGPDVNATLGPDLNVTLAPTAIGETFAPTLSPVVVTLAPTTVGETLAPTTAPVEETGSPTVTATVAVTAAPTAAATEAATAAPTVAATEAVTAAPTVAATEEVVVTAAPTVAATTTGPVETLNPTDYVIVEFTLPPIVTDAPTEAVVTDAPTAAPVEETGAPTAAEVVVTEAPTEAPVVETDAPTAAPTIEVTAAPTGSDPVVLEDILPEYTLAAFEDPLSPQSRARLFIQYDPFYDTKGETQVVQRFALATLYFALGREWTNGVASPTQDECDWFDDTGSFCNEDGLMEGLLLSNNNLDLGPIPPEIGLLSSLKQLDMSANTIAGSIPTYLGQLQMLETLNLSDNPLLTGTIPTELGSITTLTDVDLSGLDLVTGEIPPDLCDLGLFGLSFTCSEDGSAGLCGCYWCECQ